MSNQLTIRFILSLNVSGRTFTRESYVAFQLKKTRIIATLGPASSSTEKIRSLLAEGVNVFRFNFSHGDHETHRRNLETVYNVSQDLGYYPALLADLQGPKIRTGKTEGGKPVSLESGSEVVITGEKVPSNEKVISIDHPTLAQEIASGQQISINDGLIRLRAEKVVPERKEVHCIVIEGGVYSSHKGVNFPDVRLSVPSLTRKDRQDLEFILKHPFQYIALSFVRSAEDLKELRSITDKVRRDVKLIAKIEKPEAAADIDSILEVCDGIMVARGDLGVEAFPYSVPVIQKDLIARANREAKIVIVATQMLESMIEHPLPTRAESTDVANAIFDGTDAIMLSGETAVGGYPEETVQMMTRIAQTSEESAYYSKDVLDLSVREQYPPHALCEAAAYAARDLGGIPVVVITVSGDTAFYLSKIRSQSPIFAFSPDEQVTRSLALAWNVQGFPLDFSSGDITRILKDAEDLLIDRGLLSGGEMVAVLAGSTPLRGATTFLRIKRAGEE
ncbi:MAG: pyruvate kinase [Chitinispirillaceae bacterium]